MNPKGVKPKGYQGGWMARFCRVVILGGMMIPPLIGYAALPDGNADIAFQDRLRHLEEELRCLVCQNQSLADSHAELAADLRREVERLAQQGKTDEEIILFLKDRYGDFVSYRPPLTTTTLPLWFGPLLFFGIAATGIVVYTRRRSTPSAVCALSPEETVRASTLLGLNDPKRDV